MIRTAFLLRLFALFGIFSLAGQAQKPGSWPLDRLKTEVPEFRIEDPDAKIQSLIYAGESIDGKPTEVFAFYASPKTIGKKPAKDAKPFPAVVLIHGGGGTAFSEWVHLWAERGYAAIAMDLSGSRPAAPTVDAKGNWSFPSKPRSKLKLGGLAHGHAQKFDSIGGSIDDDWPYHAAASVIRAHTLIRSFPEVDADRTAVTGISWGGYTTCLVASLDDRFKAAVPVYGCGFLHEGESVQKPAIDALKDRRAAWVKAYDPGSHLGNCRIPTFWVNGTHDKHYVLDSYAKSYKQVKGPRTLRIQHMMPHGHPPGWRPMEIGLYVDSKLIGGLPLAEVGALNRDGGTVSVTVTCGSAIEKATLWHTSDEGLRSKRKWTSIAAELVAGKAVAKGLPETANTWVMTVTDARGAMVSSAVGFRE